MNELADSFMKVLGDQPLSLALVAMNLILLVFLFRSANTYDTARRETMALVVQWQKESQEIMANCVSKENLDLIVHALERDRELYRGMLPSYRKSESPAPPAVP